MKYKAMQITISGPQGCGKTTLAALIFQWCKLNKKTCLVADDEEFSTVQKGKPLEVFVRVVSSYPKTKKEKKQ